jgi:hypothetical protein
MRTRFPVWANVFRMAVDAVGQRMGGTPPTIPSDL